MDPTNDIDLSALDPPARMIVQVLRAALAESEARTARLQESVAALSDQIATLTREWREQRETAEKAAAEQLEAAQKAAAEQLGTLQEQIEIRDEQLAELRKRIFGKSSEKMPRIRTEVDEALLAEAEATLATSEENAAPEKTSEERTAERRKKGRAKSKRAREAARLKRKELPVVRQVVNVTDEQIPDGYSREDFVALGGEPKITRRVEHVREHLVVTEYVMETLVTKSGGVMVCAESPPSVCDGGHYGASVYAHVIVSKCADSLPLYRIERQLAREGASIARSVLCGLFHTGAELLLPIWERLLELVAQDPYVWADETRMPVQQEGGCKKAWIWTMLSRQIVGYAYSETRAADTPNSWLSTGALGYLTVDGYSGYNGVCSDDGPRERAGCWSHLRRLFYKSLDNAPEARELLNLIVRLYIVEHRAAEKDILGSDLHLAMRELESRPVVDQIFEWVANSEGLHSPKSAFGKALTYATNQETYLRTFLKDAKLSLDNNISERALRVMALGRKNFLFVGHDEAGQNLAALQTIVATCVLHQVNPRDYIADVLIRIQTHPNSRIDEILPMNWRPPDEPRAADSNASDT